MLSIESLLLPYDQLRDKSGISFRVRLFCPEDLDPLQHMYREFQPKGCAQGLPPRAPEQRSEWVRHLVREPANVVAERGGRIIGHAVLLDMQCGRTGEYLVFVHQDCQDCGIGTALTQAVRDLASHLGYCRIWLTVEILNGRAIRVYEKVGFHLAGPREAECEMALELVPPSDCR